MTQSAQTSIRLRIYGLNPIWQSLIDLAKKNLHKYQDADVPSSSIVVHRGWYCLPEDTTQSIFTHGISAASLFCSIFTDKWRHVYTWYLL